MPQGPVFSWASLGKPWKEQHSSDMHKEDAGGGRRPFLSSRRDAASVYCKNRALAFIVNKWGLKCNFLWGSWRKRCPLRWKMEKKEKSLTRNVFVRSSFYFFFKISSEISTMFFFISVKAKTNKPGVLSSSCPQVCSWWVQPSIRGYWEEHQFGYEQSWAVGPALPLCVYLALDKSLGLHVILDKVTSRS